MLPHRLLGGCGAVLEPFPAGTGPGLPSPRTHTQTPMTLRAPDGEGKKPREHADVISGRLSRVLLCAPFSGLTGENRQFREGQLYHETT